jgi:CHAD domain-containing protein
MSGVEAEIKLEAPDEFSLPDLDDAGADVLSAPAETVELDATYFDTTDLRLARAGASLRMRSDEGWVVKLPISLDDGGLLTRDEIHIDDGRRNGATPPDDALDLVRALTRNAPVDAVARLHTTRRRVRLRSTDARPLGEVVDDRVEVRQGDSDDVVSMFRELEVELTDQATDAHRAAVLAHLRHAGAGAADPTPKIVRALGPAATGPPDVVVPELGGPHPSVDIVVRRAIATAVARLLAHDPGARVGKDPEAVHQARVATRRLRSDLRTFHALVDERWSNELRDELRWLGDVLGGVRDTDVLIERLEHNVPALPEVDRSAAELVIDRLRRDREAAREQLLRALRSDRYDTLLNRLVLASQRPRLLLRIDDGDDAELMRAAVRRPWERLRDAVEALPPDPPDSSLHDIRIRAKRARYAAEAVAPAFGKPARAFARAVVDVQDVLGEHQDAVIAGEWLRRAAAQSDNGHEGFAAGELAALEREAAQTSRDAWPATWQQASRKRLRSWL